MRRTTFIHSYCNYILIGLSRIFYAFLAGFNTMFNCSGPLAFPINDTVNLAYVHKFMDLDQVHVGYFLNQVVLSAEYFGFSQKDSVYMSTVFNGQFNVRCAAPVGTQLYSVCQNPTCPLAILQDCDAYSNLGPYGAISAITGSTTWSQSDPTAAASSASTSISSQATTSSLSGNSPSKPRNTGVITGIAVGSVALGSLLVLAILFILKRKKKSRSQELSAFNPSYTDGRVDPNTGQVAKELRGIPVSELPS